MLGHQSQNTRIFVENTVRLLFNFVKEAVEQVLISECLTADPGVRLTLYPVGNDLGVDLVAFE